MHVARHRQVVLRGRQILADGEHFHAVSAQVVHDTEDFLVSSLLLPIGSLVYLLFCVTKWGWGFDKYLAEANRGTGLKFSPKLKLYFQWILPILILIILIQGLI